MAKLVSRRAYDSDSVAKSLIAQSDMHDVDWRFVDAFDSPTSLVNRVGDKVVLTRDATGRSHPGLPLCPLVRHFSPRCHGGAGLAFTWLP